MYGLCILLLCSFVLACSHDTQIIHVSTTGNDQNFGSSSEPLASVKRAIELAADMLTEDDARAVTIKVSAGIHQITSELELSSDQLPLDKNQLSFEGDTKGGTILSGGIVIDDWKKGNDGLYWSDVPAPIMNVRELFIDDRRATRARHPNKDYLRAAQVGADKRTHIFYSEGDFPIPKETSQTELILLHDWSISRIALREIDLQEAKITATDSIGAKVLDFFTLDNWEKKPRYFLENDVQFIDLPFEWIFDQTRQQIAIKLPENTSPKDLRIVVPISAGILRLNGSQDDKLSNVHFNNIQFQHSAWTIPKMGYGGIQATHFDPRPNLGTGWSVVPAAVYATYMDSCTFSNCSFAHLGGSGLWLGEGCSNNVVSNCLFKDISGNGIMIGEGRDRKIEDAPWWQHAPEQVAKNNLIEKSIIRDCGKQFFGAVGIWCGLTRETIIEENEIYNLPYTGISIGWMWNPTPTPAKNNMVQGNHIHHIMHTLSDGGGIYMLGLQPGSKLLNNLIHDVTINVGRAESNGMFLDEGITDVLVADNIIYNIAKSPIRFHKATTNTVRENYLFCGKEIPPFRYNRTDSNLIDRINNRIYHNRDPSYTSSLEAALEAFHSRTQ
ncbi:MAG: right-handed parallel beta-helix repeat-containing protein [Saprospiraceae bacterium]|nr:right-handed parallel beta-helix repeat-containing protein [Saprospiraceae bacterium]